MSPHPKLEWARAARARAALAAYPRRFQGPLRCEQVGENATFRVRAPAGVFALRLYRPGRWSYDEVQVEHDFMAHLGSRLGVLPAVRGSDRETLQVVDEVGAAALFPWAPGRLLGGYPSRASLGTAGEYLGRLHRRGASFRAAGPRPRWDRPGLIDHAVKQVEGAWPGLIPGRPCPDLRSAARAGTRRWKQLGLDEALIHADLHWGNLKLGPAGPHALDFDDCGYAPLAYDLAVTLYSSGERGRDEAGARVLLDAYRSTGATPPSAEAVRLMIWARFHFLLAWILERPELWGPGELAKRIEARTDTCMAYAAELGLAPRPRD